jgi:hypothetical protein
METPELGMATLVREELLAAIPADHPAARNERVNLAALKEDTFLVPKRHGFRGLYELVMESYHTASFIPCKTQAARFLRQLCVWARRGARARIFSGKCPSERACLSLACDLDFVGFGGYLV